MVTPQGITNDPDKIKLVTDWPPPRNLKEVRSFVGLFSYYRRYVKDFAKVAELLHGLTRKNVRFEWTSSLRGGIRKIENLSDNCPSPSPTDGR